MTTNNSQIGHSPSEPLFESQSNIDQLLAVENTTTSQPLIHLNTTNMIPSQIPLLPNILEYNNVIRPQLAQRARRQQQRQLGEQGGRRRGQLQRDEGRQRQEQTRQQGQQRQQQDQTRQQLSPPMLLMVQGLQENDQWVHKLQQLHQQEKEERKLRSEERLERIRQRAQQRREDPQRRERFNNIRHDSNEFDDWSDEIFTEKQLEAYDLESLTPQDRWNQEQLNELEGFAVLEYLASLHNELEELQQVDTNQQINEEERPPVRNTQELIQDHFEQLNQIEAAQNIKYEERQERNSEELIQHEQWENVDFLLQQLNQP